MQGGISLSVENGVRTNGPRRVKLPWVDFAKGLCMVLVVLFHSALFMETQVNGDMVGFWWPVSEALSPIRMPLFFFISGLLSVSALGKSLGQSRQRTLGLYYVYLIWTFLFLMRLWLPLSRNGAAAPSAGDLVLSLLLPTSFWYLYALPVFFLASWLLTRVLGRFSAYALIPLALLSAVSPLLEPLTQPVITAPLDALKIPSLAAHFVWFYLGIHGRSLWGRIMASASYGRLALAGVAYAALVVPMMLFDLKPELKVPLSCLALYAAAQLVALVRMDARIPRWLQTLGSQTLPVYIFHIFLISVISALVKVTGLLYLLQSNLQLSNALLPPLMTVPIVVVTVWLGKLIRSGPLWWLLEAPPALVGRRSAPKPAAADAPGPARADAVDGPVS